MTTAAQATTTDDTFYIQQTLTFLHRRAQASPRISRLRNTPTGLQYADSYAGFLVNVDIVDLKRWRINLHAITYSPNHAFRTQSQQDNFSLACSVALADNPAPDYSVTLILPSLSEYRSSSAAENLYRDLARKTKETVLQYRYREILSRIPGMQILDMDQVAPFDISGIWDGHRFHFEMNYGYIGLNVEPGELTDITWSGNPKNYPRWTAAGEYASREEVSMTDNEAVYALCLLASQIDVEPYHYVFTYEDEESVAPLEHYEGKEYEGKGHTLEDARRNAYENTCLYYVDREPSPAEGALYREDKFVTQMKDTRVFPPRPDFTVLDVWMPGP